jgi:hypothetical protein
MGESIRALAPTGLHTPLRCLGCRARPSMRGTCFAVFLQSQIRERRKYARIVESPSLIGKRLMTEDELPAAKSTSVA